MELESRFRISQRLDKFTHESEMHDAKLDMKGEPIQVVMYSGEDVGTPKDLTSAAAESTSSSSQLLGLVSCPLCYGNY